MLSEYICLFDQKPCPFRRRLCLWSRIAFDMDERGNERDLKIDLLASQRRTTGQRRY